VANLPTARLTSSASGTEQPRQLTASERSEAFGRGSLCDLAKIGPPSSARRVPIHALDHRRYDVDQTGIAAGVQVETLQSASEVGRAGRARDLRQQPEAADQRFFSCEVWKAAFSSLGAGRSDLIDRRPFAEQPDYRLPVACLGQNAEARVAH
jgi:hypothetical protein